MCTPLAGLNIVFWGRLILLLPSLCLLRVTCISLQRTLEVWNSETIGSGVQVKSSCTAVCTGA